ncbi:MAG: hypothetical protein P1P88_16960 [Bacteroidales bacterium]|nr:hypothetical protein [Bacteroidales bacterium]
MLIYRYLILILTAFCISIYADAQQAEAVPGKNGIFISFGNEIPKNFNYVLERRPNGSNDKWQIIFSSSFPKDVVDLKQRLMQINAKNPFYNLPDSLETTFFFKRITKFNSRDSIAYYNSSPQFLEAMGTGYFDTGIKPNQKYEYQLSKTANKRKESGTQIIKEAFFPGKTPTYDISLQKTSIQGSKVNLYYYVKGNNKPFGFKVYRQYALQSSFKEITPITKYFNQNDSLMMYISDNDVVEKLIYKYFVLPFDIFGNEGNCSDTILISNVPEYGQTPVLTNLKSVSLDNKSAIRLSWRFTDVNNLRGISIYRSKHFDSGFKHLISLPANDTSFVDKSIEAVQTYYYYLIIHGAYGDSPPSSKIAGMLKSSQNLITAPQNITIEQVAAGNKISWQRIEKGTIGYYVYRGEGYRPELKQYSDLIHSDSVNTSFIDSTINLREGQAYSYAVAAVNINNHKSPLSKQVIANPIKPNLPTPLNLQVLQNPNGALLMWEDMTKISPYVIGYQVYRKVTTKEGKVIEEVKIINKGNESAGNNSYLDSTIQRGIRYTYVIKAVGIEKSESAQSYEVGFFVPKITPHPPSGLRAFITAEGVVIQWDTPLAEKIKSFKVYREELGKKMKLVAELAPEVTDFEDNLPQKSKDYFYKISVVNSDGVESDLSEEVGVKF